MKKELIKRGQLAGCAGVCLFFMLAGCAAPPQQSQRGYHQSRPAPAARRIKLPDVLPRVMVIIDEQSLGTIATSEVESMALRKLLELNIPLVDQDMVRANIARGQQMLQMAGDNRGAAALGARFGADLVLVGEAVAKPSARRIADTNLRSYQAVVTLRAVRTDNAAALAAASEDSTQVGIEDVSGSAKVLRTAAEMALDKVIPDMLARWTPSAEQGAVVTAGRQLDLTIGGVDQIWMVRAIRETLRARTDLSNVTQRGYSAGMVEFSVEAAVPAEELAEELVLSPPEGLRMQVLDIGGGRIQMRAVAQ